MNTYHNSLRTPHYHVQQPGMQYVVQQRGDGGVTTYPNSCVRDAEPGVRLVSRLQLDDYTHEYHHSHHPQYQEIQNTVALPNRGDLRDSFQHVQQPHDVRLAHMNVNDQLVSGPIVHSEVQHQYWMDMFRYLLQLCLKTGGLGQALVHVHHTRDVELVAWIEEQDEQCVRLSRGLPTSLSMEQIEMLSRIGFAIDNSSMDVEKSQENGSRGDVFGHVTHYGSEIPSSIQGSEQVQGICSQNDECTFSNSEQQSSMLSHPRLQPEVNDHTQNGEDSVFTRPFSSSRKISCIEDIDDSGTNDGSVGSVSRHTNAHSVVQVTPNPRTNLAEGGTVQSLFSIAEDSKVGRKSGKRGGKRGGKRVGGKRQQPSSTKHGSVNAEKSGKRGRKQKINSSLSSWKQSFPGKSDSQAHIIPEVHANVSPDLLSSDESTYRENVLQSMDIEHCASCLISLKTSSIQCID